MNNIERIKILKLLKNRPDLICGQLYKRSYKEVNEILNLEEWSNPKYASLLTSGIWNSSLNEIKEILHLKEWEDIKFQRLLTPNIWHRRAWEVKKILHMKQWQDEKFAHLLTPTIWNSSYTKIKMILQMEEWNNPDYEFLLTPSIFSTSMKNIRGNIAIFEQYKILSYINISSLRKDPQDNELLLQYLSENGIDLIVNGKINAILTVCKKQLKERYGIDFNQIKAKQYSLA